MPSGVSIPKLPKSEHFAGPVGIHVEKLFKAAALAGRDGGPGGRRSAPAVGRAHMASVGAESLHVLFAGDDPESQRLAEYGAGRIEGARNVVAGGYGAAQDGVEIPDIPALFLAEQNGMVIPKYRCIRLVCRLLVPEQAVPLSVGDEDDDLAHPIQPRLKTEMPDVLFAIEGRISEIRFRIHCRYLCQGRLQCQEFLGPSRRTSTLIGV